MLILYSCSGWPSEAGLEVNTSYGTSTVDSVKNEAHPGDVDKEIQNGRF